MKAKPRDWALLLSLGMIWGAAFMATKIAALEISPLTIAALRLIIASAILYTVLRLRGERLPGISGPRERLFWVMAAGMAFLSNALPFTSLAWAQRHIDSGLAGVFMTSVPLFVLPLGHFFVPGERLTFRKTLGFAFGFAGVGVLIGPSAFSGLGTGSGLMLMAQAACLAAAIGYASGSIVSKRAPQLGLLKFGTAALILAAAMTVPMAALLERPWEIAPSGAALLAVAYLSIAATALATIFLLEVIRSAGPSFMSLVNYQVPVWAVVFGTVFLGETPSPRLWVALVLILIGLGIAQGVLGIRRGGHARG